MESLSKMKTRIVIAKKSDYDLQKTLQYYDKTLTQYIAKM